MTRLLIPLLAALSLVAGAEGGEIPGLTSKTLPNGLEVIVIENHSSPIVTVEIAVRSGASVESPDYNGLSHLYEHMFFKGNRVIPNQTKYHARLEELGVSSWNGTTRIERVNYFLTMPSENTREGTTFLRDALLYPLFDQKELERERVVVLGELDRGEATPFFHLRREVDRRLWTTNFSRNNVPGDREMIVTTPREKLMTLKERYYVPNNAALLFAGDIRPDDAYALAEEMFSDWKSAPDPAKAYPIPVPPPLKESMTLAILQPVKTATLRIAWQGPSMRDDVAASFAADVFTFILSQPSSRFWKNLVDSGLFDEAALRYTSQAHTGPILFQGTTTAEKLDAANAAARKELDAITAEDYFTDEELAYAKKQLEYSEVYGREQPSTFIHTVSFWWAASGLDYYRNYLDNLRAVTRKDIQTYLRRYVVAKPHVTGVLIAEEQLAKATMLKKAEIIRPQTGSSATAMSSTTVARGVTTEEFDVDGMHVILRRNPQSEVVTAKMFYAGGLPFLGPARAGMEPLALEVAARETEHYPKATMARELTRLGARLSSNSQPDFSTFTLTAVASNFEESARIFLDAVAHPKFTNDEVLLARDRQLNALAREEDDPDAYLNRLAKENAFGTHPYALNPYGTKELITAVSADQLRQMYRDTVTRSRLLFVIAGNATREQVTTLVRNGLTDLPKGDYKPTPVPPVPGSEESSSRVVVRDLPTVYVQGFFLAPHRSDPDHVALSVAVSALRTRLLEEIRTKRNLSYAPDAWITLDAAALYVTTSNPNAAIAVMRDEVRRMRTEPLSASELTGTVNSLRTQILQAMESSDAAATMLGEAKLTAGDWRAADELPRRFERTSAEEVRAAMEKWAQHVDFVVVGKIDELDRSLLTSF